jgi:hypothetical protein
MARSALTERIKLLANILRGICKSVVLVDAEERVQVERFASDG